MTNSTLVSVVMPSYNAEQFLGEAIASVVAQTCQDWELIVVDDGSTDRSAAIAAEWTAREARIRLLRLERNAGPARARNVAIEDARGRYIAFLDSDDLWLPDKLEVQLAEMRRHDAALSFTAYKKIDAQGRVGDGVIGVPATITYEELLDGNAIGCLTAMFDTGRIGKIYLPELGRTAHEDYGLWLRVLRGMRAGPTAESRRGVGIDRVLALYRVREGSVSSNKLKAAVYQWIIYRDHEGLSLPRSLYHFCHYALRGYRKYKAR